MSDPVRIAKKKLVTIRRYERRLRNRLADIDWEENELLPEVERMEALAAQGKIPTFELEAGDAPSKD